MTILNRKQIKYGFDYFHRDEPETEDTLTKKKNAGKA